ncbi:MAG TPA: hypothetical protein VFT44_11995 [Pyrinomonadaceae bacterium]|nr:hypothetical protein [Pyrinomonadaceae bacterium]
MALTPDVSSARRLALRFSRMRMTKTICLVRVLWGHAKLANIPVENLLPDDAITIWRIL